MSFKQIIGQERAVTVLQNALKKRRIAGAYLFEGPAGCGKRFTALTFAKALNCLNPVNGIDACGECNSCKKIQDGNHIDVNWTEAEPESSVIKIEQVRQLQGGINLKPYEGKFKVFCMLDADIMTEEAQNAFLKTLEEPPVKSVIILTCTSTRRLFKTIISRCQLVKFSRLDMQSSITILTKKYQIDNNTAGFLAFVSEADLLNVRTLLEREVNILSYKNHIIDNFLLFLKNQTDELWFLNEDNTAILRALCILLWWYRDILVVKERGFSAQIAANKDRHAELIASAGTLSISFLCKVINTILEAIQAMESKCNPKLALDVMAADILKITTGDDISSISINNNTRYTGKND